MILTEYVKVSDVIENNSPDINNKIKVVIRRKAERLISNSKIKQVKYEIGRDST